MNGVQDLYELSPMQQGMLFHRLYQPESPAYFEQRSCLLTGQLQVDAFKRAWQQVVSHYDVLRTSFHWEDLDNPLQVVHSDAQLPWVEQDWRSLSAVDQPRQLNAFLATDRAQGFDLETAPLMRCALLRLSDDHHRFVWSHHHLLMDGWCNGLLIKTVLALYEAECQGKALTLAPAPKYRDYIVWLQQQDPAKAQSYWQAALAGFEAPTPLLRDVSQRLASQQDSTQDAHQEQHHACSQQFTAQLKRFAAQQHLTLNTLVQGAWAVLLSRYSDREDILFGATVSGRPPELPRVEEILGLFINTLPVRAQVASNAELLPWLQQLQHEQQLRDAYSYSALTEIQAASELPAGLPLFDSLVVFENYPVSMDRVLQSQTGGLTISDGRGFEQTNYPLNLVAIPGEQFRFRVSYDPAQFSNAMIGRLLGHLETVLQTMVAKPHQRLADLPLCTELELEQVRQWNQTQQPIPELRIDQLVAQQANRQPNAIALRCEGKALSYGELNRQVEQMAQYLQDQGLKPGDRLAICLPRSLDLPVALLATLKLGAAYVPLDPAYPLERLRYILEDAEPAAMLTIGSLETVTSNLTWDGLQLQLDPIQLDQIQPSLEQQSDSAKLNRVDAPASVAYVIYTSGSTGKPKGVPIGHRSLTNLLHSMAQAPGLSPGDRLLAVTTIAFDIAALELFLPLSLGAEVVIATADAARDGEQLAQQIAAEQITAMQATPTTWRLLLAQGWQAPPGFKALCGGEALDLSLSQQLVETGCELWNLYGPTETTIWSGAIQLEAERLSAGIVPLGRAIANTQFYVLDRQHRPLPVGIAGELYIGGLGLSPGYWQREDLTQARFVEVDLAAWDLGSGIQKLYATGDRVRSQSDGTLEYLGRYDDQIKLRGFRIELGEIESTLETHPDIEKAVVRLWKNNQAVEQLIAYIASSSDSLQVNRNESVETANSTHGNGKNSSELAAFAAQHLPAYMVPTVFIAVKAWPLTPNGKIDRKSLPEPTQSSLSTPQTTGLQSPIDSLMAGIWSNVLGCSVQRNDNFFELGGHSLLATRAISQIRQAVERDIPLRTLFDFPKLSDFAEQIQLALAGSNLSLSPIEIADRSQPLPLSPAQQRQWVIAQLEPDNPFYLITSTVRLSGPLNPSLLQASLNQLVEHHEVLRTRFEAIDGVPVQVIEPSVNAEIEVTPEPLDQPDAIALDQAPLLQVRLRVISDQEHQLQLALHHIAADGWSMGVMLKELTERYAALQAERQPNLQPLPIQYADYAVWQRDWLASGVAEQQLIYWKQQLKDAPTLLDLPTDYPRPAQQQFAGASHLFRLSADHAQALEQLSQRSGTTLFMTLLATFKVLLSRYSQQTDLLVGTPIANRQRTELEGLIGMFANTLVLRTDLSGNPRFAELLEQVRRTALEAYAAQDVPFEQVVEALELPRSWSHSPLFQVMFVLQQPVSGNSLEASEAEAHQDLTWEPLPLESQTAKFDLTLSLQQDDEGLQGRFEYRTDLFEAATIERMAGHLCELLKAIPNQAEFRISDLPWLTAAEQQQIERWQQGESWQLGDHSQQSVSKTERLAQPDPSRCIHQVFEAQVLQTPEAIALRMPNEAITYQDLNHQANQLAHYLQQQGIGLETSVGIWIERTPKAIIAFLAILKAGGTYVPLDPSYPTERLAQRVCETEMPLVLTLSAIARLPDALSRDPALRQICLEQDAAAIAQCSQNNPATKATPENLAYILYTSGSTGQPKGVCIPHRGVVRLVKAAEYCHFGPDEVILQAAPLTFDASTFEIWAALLNGGENVVLPTQQPSLAELGDALEQYGITTLWLTAGLFHLMVDEQLDSLKGLRQLLAGGDALSTTHVQKALAVMQGQLINGYGPTENTTFSCTQRLTAEQFDLGQAPAIGRPIAQTQAYILDPHYQPVPVGIPGELYLGGAGLARGYLNRPELTAQSFIPNPFWRPGLPGSPQLYKTGDQVCYRPDGSIEYLGRLDQQVKLRGFRIELGEIEAVLDQHPGLSSNVLTVATNPAGQKALVAYVVAHPNPSERPQVGSRNGQLRSFLAERLPDFMLPSQWIWLEKLPLTANGKVDRRALPSPSWDSSAEQLIVPETKTEQMLLGIWQGVLNQDPISIQDNFFELGGDSILAIQIVSRARQAGLMLSPKDLFQHQTIAELAAIAPMLDTALPTTAFPTTALLPIAAQATVVGPAPLTPIQQWFFEQNLAEPHHFNQAVCLTAPPQFDRAAFQTALQAVTAHHDVFKLRFKPVDQSWQQEFVDATESPEVTWYDFSCLKAEEQELAIEAQANQIQSSLNLSQGPLLRVAGFDLGTEQPAQLLIVIHHLMVDGLSWRIFVEDLKSAYQQVCDQSSIQLPAKSVSYQQWATWLKEQANALEHRSADQQSMIWPKPLPLDLSTETNQMDSSETVSVNLTIAETEALLYQIPGLRQLPIQDLLLTGLAQALTSWTAETACLIDLESHGRTASLTSQQGMEEYSEFPDVSRTMGWFTQIYPALLSLPKDEHGVAIAELEPAIHSIHQQLQQAAETRFEWNLRHYLQDCDDSIEQPQAEISFNYLGQFDGLLASTDGFQLAQTPGLLRSPKSNRFYLLEINSWVRSGQLQIEWTYSKNRHHSWTIETLAQKHLQAIQTLIQYCQQPIELSEPLLGETSIPSDADDFSLVDLDQMALDSILEQVAFQGGVGS